MNFHSRPNLYSAYGGIYCRLVIQHSLPCIKGADLILLLDYFIFVVELEVVAIVGALLHKPCHFVLVKIYLTVVALVFIIKYVVRTKLAISLTHPCHLLQYLKIHIYCIQKVCSYQKSQISPVGYRLQSSGFGTVHS